MTEPDLLLGVQAIADFLGMRLHATQHRIDQGLIPTFKLGAIVCDRRSMLNAWLAECEAKAHGCASALTSPAPTGHRTLRTISRGPAVQSDIGNHVPGLRGRNRVIKAEGEAAFSSEAISLSRVTSEHYRSSMVIHRLRPLDISNCSPKQKKLALEYAADARRFEIERFWQRSLFFWGFIGAAFVAYGILGDEKHHDHVATLGVSAFGVLASLAWLLVNRGSKYWQEAWEAKVATLEAHVLGTNLFSNIEPVTSQGVLGVGPYSVSRLTSMLSIISILTWVGLLARQLDFGTDLADPRLFRSADDIWAFSIVTLTIALAIWMLVVGRSTWSLRSKRKSRSQRRRSRS